ncbi:MAG: transporter substrate-binding domain-containing protein [Candidatus Riflebacteria bacterium]
MLNFRVLLTVLIVFFCSFSVTAQTIVKVGIYQNPPKVFLDEKGQPAGFFVELLGEIAKQEKWQLEFVFAGWSECLRNLESGHIDLMTDVAYTESRIRKYDLNKVSVISDWFQAYCAEPGRINSILDLNQLKVSILAESVQLEFFKNLLKNLDYQCHILELQNYDDIFNSVKKGQADVLLTNRFAGKLLGQKYGLVETSLIFNPTSLHFAADKGKNGHILQKIDQHLEIWKKDSASFYYQCLERNLKEKVEERVPLWAMRLFFGLIAIICAAFLIIREFRRQLEKRTAELIMSNRKLEQTLDQLQLANEKAVNQERLNALGQMASGIAHDFNNILTPITGFSELLIDEPKLLDDRKTVRDYLESIRDAGYDGIELVKRMKAFYRQRESMLEKIPVDLNQLIDNVVTLTRFKWQEQAQFEGRKILVEFTPQNRDPVNISPSHIREVLVNLIINAVDAMPDGGVIQLATFKQDGFSGVSIKDNGTGMDSETLANCFRAFYTTKGEKGTGIGLSMVKEICEWHDARLVVNSEPGIGTEFKILFHDFGREAEKITSAVSGLVNASLKILLVDDDSRVLMVSEAMLANAGHRVVCCSNGKDAFSQLQKCDFDLVISDYSMPDMTGLVLIREVRKFKPIQKFIIFSGSNIDQAAFEIQNLGVSILEKPLKMSCLNQFIGSMFLCSGSGKNS